MKDSFKFVLRRSYQQIRESLSPSYQKTASDKVCKHIRNLDKYRYAKRIALYHSVHGEISLNSLWSSAPLQGKYCYFPVLNANKTLSFLPATPTTPFTKNRYGILEPKVDKETAALPSQLDIIFLPLVAFDERGTRLGRGEGYYDRTLAERDSPLLIGVAYEFQRHYFIEPEPWDVPLAAIVTPKKIYWPSQSPHR